MSTLSINLTPGYLPADGELIDNSILRQIARPTVQLDGTIGAASIADGGVTTAKLADGVLTADATGRAKMVDGFVTAAKINATQDWTGKTLSGTPTVNTCNGVGSAGVNALLGAAGGGSLFLGANVALYQTAALTYVSGPTNFFPSTVGACTFDEAGVSSPILSWRAA